MIESASQTTLFSETDNGEIVVTGTKITFDSVVTAYDKQPTRIGKLIAARSFAYDNELDYGHAVLLFRFVRDMKDETFWHDCDDTDDIDDTA